MITLDEPQPEVVLEAVTVQLKMSDGSTATLELKPDEMLSVEMDIEQMEGGLLDFSQMGREPMRRLRLMGIIDSETIEQPEPEDTPEPEPVQ